MHEETYRMLGREHDVDLEREAARRRLAAEIRGPRRACRSRELGRSTEGAPPFAVWLRLFAPVRQHEGV